MAAGGVARAQPAGPEEPATNRPQAARRVVRFFDFDTPDPFGLPLIWKLAQDRFPILEGQPRPGFPIYNGAELDVRNAGAGAGGSGGSMRLWTRGGSTCLRLSPGVIPVFPDTEYLVSGRIRTGDLSCARACLMARYLDRANQPITGSEVRSELVASPESGDPWRTVSV